MRYDYILMDFDDTIWSRDKKDIETSIENVKLVNKLADKIIIISGNSRSSIQTELVDNNLKLNCDVWCDVNTTCYNNFNFKDSLYDLNIMESGLKIMEYLRSENINFLAVGYNSIYNIKIRPVEDRDTLISSLNSKFKELGINDCTAIKAGKTTVDIIHIYNSKSKVYNHLDLDRYNTLYIGDEIEDGNDMDVAKLCSNYISVNSVEETNRVLKEMIENDLRTDILSRESD